MKFSRLYILISVAVLFGACGGAETEDQSAQRIDSTGVERDAAARSDQDRDSTQVVLFLGNSLSAGAGVDPEDAFPSLIEERIDSLGWNFRVLNAGLSGETSSGGLRRIDWLLNEPIAVLVLELGGNDGLRGIPVTVTRNNLAQIIEKTRAVHPGAEIVIAGMQIPPNLGHDYTSAFREMYPSLAEEYDVHLIPFLLEGVGGVDSLMQSDGIHPTAEGHRVVARNVWETLTPVLREVRARAS